LLVATLYGLISIFITFFNKAVFSLYNFKGSNTLTLGQIIFSILILRLLKSRGTINFPDFNMSIAKSLFSLSGAFLGMVISGLAALRFVNVPMFGVLRRLTTFLVIVLQYITLRKLVSYAELTSVIVMVLGAVIGGWGDLTFDAWGYFFDHFELFFDSNLFGMDCQES